MADPLPLWRGYAMQFSSGGFLKVGEERAVDLADEREGFSIEGWFYPVLANWDFTDKRILEHVECETMNDCKQGAISGFTKRGSSFSTQEIQGSQGQVGKCWFFKWSQR